VELTEEEKLKDDLFWKNNTYFNKEKTLPLSAKF
jgi:hypothetical protein